MYIEKVNTYLDILKERHAEDGKDEHDEEEEKTDVEEGWHRHHQGEQQGSDTLGSL